MLNWDSVNDAIQYRLFSCNEPYGEFEYIGTTSYTSWTLPLSGEVQFFQVTASDE